MTDILLVVITVILAVATGFLISTLIEIRRAARKTSEFLKSTEESLKTTLKETEDTLRDVRDIAENVSSITRDARSFTSSLSDTADSIRAVSHKVEGSVSRVAALRVGLKTAFEVFAKKLISRKGEER